MAERRNSVETIARKEEHHLHCPDLSSVRFSFCGHHACRSGYSYGPIVRDEYILHFIIRGTGYYQIDGRTWRIEAGSSFLIFPGHIVHYQADQADPWEYYWVAFDGHGASLLVERSGLRVVSPLAIHSDPATIADSFRDALSAARERSTLSDLTMLSLFFRVLRLVVEDSETATSDPKRSLSRDNTDPHIVQAVTWIQDNYFRCEVSINTIAQYVSLERTYFSTLFRREMGISPGRFLTRIRVENACRLLAESDTSIKKIAYSVGYRDQTYFDKVFRRTLGYSPSEFRHSIHDLNALESGSPDSEIRAGMQESFFS